MAMTILGIMVLGLIIGFLYVSGENPNSNAHAEQSYYEQSSITAVERSENRTPKY